MSGASHWGRHCLSREQLGWFTDLTPSDWDPSKKEQSIMPTLKCDGWWEQAGFGRQPMNDLIIEFSSRELTGSGEDIVGPFTLIGRIDDDRVFIQKQYLGQHWIDYHGTTSGEGDRE
jgi:hypothetical protein